MNVIMSRKTIFIIKKKLLLKNQKYFGQGENSLLMCHTLQPGKTCLCLRVLPQQRTDGMTYD